ncbi:MAG TPA: shikimate kinase [Candidatus Eisenbacteria bacterium]|nr:shikimate kinase [Candidatus Eisenbacteria bacterium]
MTARIALIGLSGAGKSTVAPLLAERLGFRCADLDEAIAGAEGAPVHEILTSRGEDAFRELEADALRAALEGEGAGPGVVVACGAGILAREASRALLRGRAYVVWLDVSPETAALRLQDAAASTRPLLRGGTVAERLREQWEARRPLYKEAADASVPTDRLTPAGVAEAIETLWKGRRAWGSSGS